MDSRNAVVLGVWISLLGMVLSSSAEGGYYQFAVAEIPGEVVHGDSFVVAIEETETELLAHARALADWAQAGADPEDSPGATILVADMAAGADGINRDYFAPGSPRWSWHLVGTPEFGDVTAEILDGWPSFVEQDVEGWIENTGGRIGFWNYTVVSEIGFLIPEPSTWVLAVTASFGLLVGGVWRRRNGAPGGSHG